MTYTEYFQYTTGSTLYGKAQPLNATWATGIVTMTEDASSYGEYSSSSFADDTNYVIYLQAGGSEASSDTKLGLITPPILDALGMAASDLDAQLTAIDDYLDTEIAAIKAKTDLITAGSITTIPSRVEGSRITLFNSETQTVTLTTDSDYTAKTMKVTFEKRGSSTDTSTVADGSLTKTTTTVSFTAPSAVTDNLGDYLWALRDTSNDEVLLHGHCVVKYAPLGD